MSTVGEAVRTLGVVGDDGDLIIVKIGAKGVQHFTLDEVADKTLDKDTYLATGTYGRGTVSRHGGRTATNLLRINELPFDFDLSDSTGIPKDELWEMPDDALWPLIEGLREEVETTFAAISLTLHRIDYTGYGLAGYLRLPLHKPDAIPAIQELHARIVKRVNAIARVKLCDPQVTDAGTRIMRLPGCLNTKGAIPRRTRTLVQRDGMVNEAQLTAAAGATSSMPARIVPVSGAVLDDATAQQLVDAVAPHWRVGYRHHIALALSGLLAKAGVPEEQTLSIVRDISGAAADFWDRPITEVHTTYERVRAGQDVKGFYGLQDVLPVELVQWLDALGQRVRAASAPVLTAHGISPVQDLIRQPKEFLPSLPAECLRGWFKNYVDIARPTSSAPDAYHLASAMVLVGATMGRTVVTRYVSRNVHANLYVMLVGVAGTSKKDTAIELALEVPKIRPRGLTLTEARSLTVTPYELLTDVGSAEGLINVLSQSPNALLYITEYQRLVRNAHRQSTSTIFPLLTAAWGTPGELSNTTKGNPLKALFPYISIIAAVQPNILAQEMLQEDIESGYATRWLYVYGEGGEELDDPPEIDEMSAYRLYRDLLGKRQRYADVEGGMRLYFSDAAKTRWSEWFKTNANRPIHGDDEASMRSRLAVHVRKVALVYAAADGAMEIDAEHLEAGIAFVEWCWAHTRELMKNWGVGVWVQIENRIEAVLKPHGVMLRKDLAYHCRNRRWSAREFTQVLDAMIKNGTVEMPMPGAVKWAD